MKTVFIKLDKEYEIRLSFKAIKDFESKTGKGIHEDLRCSSAVTNIEKLWAMLRQNKPELTIEDVEALVEKHSHVLKIRNPILSATTAALVSNDPNAEAPAETND